MNRTGIIIAFAIAAMVGLLFGVVPELDLELSALFVDPATGKFLSDRACLFGIHWAAPARDASMWIVAALAVPAAVALVFKLLVPSLGLAIPARAIMFLLGTLTLAPGLLTNVLLKDHWGRARPLAVHEFGGADRFTPWWDPRGPCPRNCSFVTGEGAGAFWTLAPAALAPVPLRPFAYAAAIGFGAAVGTLRMAFGGHFFTDVVWSGVLTFLVIWIVHGVLYRWRSAPSDHELEARLDRLIDTLHAAIGRIMLRLRSLVYRRTARL
jgi:membrane-associated PAP2 superfamily phosphatase